MDKKSAKKTESPNNKKEGTVGTNTVPAPSQGSSATSSQVVVTRSQAKSVKQPTPESSSRNQGVSSVPSYLDIAATRARKDPSPVELDDDSEQVVSRGKNARLGSTPLYVDAQGAGDGVDQVTAKSLDPWEKVLQARGSRRSRTEAMETPAVLGEQ